MKNRRLMEAWAGRVTMGDELTVGDETWSDFVQNWESFQANPLDGYSLYRLFQEPKPVEEEERMDEELHSFVPPMTFDESSRGHFEDAHHTGHEEYAAFDTNQFIQAYIIGESLPRPAAPFPPQPDVSMLEHTSFDNFWDEDEVMDIQVGNGEVWTVNKAMIDDSFWMDSAIDGLSKRLEAVDINKRKAKESLEDIWIDDPDMKQKMEEIKRGKRKVGADIWGNNQGLWDETGRNYICERQVDRTRMGTHAIVDIINQRRLQFFFDPIKGFKPKLVLDFYSNMEVDEKEEKITSRLGKKTVLVTPTIIAKYLKNYQRPSHRSTTYPEHGWSKTEEEIQNALTNKPMKQDRFVHGRLFEKYRVINKVVHYNLCPHSSEKLPRKEDGEVIFVFGSSDEVVDWALLIWNSMVRFRKRTAPSKPNIPFPAMVTALCESQGVLVPEKLLPGSPGPITGGSLEKSKSLS
ncbi:hypothetical protein RHSIM_Rhsim06G0103800 [Rhododendron simsii]|uniref:Putative plant transposon protein domain-containing protein n=1 Tax=Rhododendron simsii TaxID=118357 RepID=A0A834GXN9_RHOSS|nr:hypothetical protein RHSIM_Rhsim06G0103800 [Rhododendron simsii]